MPNDIQLNKASFTIEIDVQRMLHTAMLFRSNFASYNDTELLPIYVILITALDRYEVHRDNDYLCILAYVLRIIERREIASDPDNPLNKAIEPPTKDDDTPTMSNRKG